MTEQPKNTDFHDSPFLQGANAAYVEQLYGQWARNPEAVDQAWDAFFRGRVVFCLPSRRLVWPIFCSDNMAATGF